MKVLVTGASGYLGQHVVAALVARGVETVALSSSACDLSSRQETRRTVASIGPNVIIHCAAVVPKKPQDYHDTAAAAMSVFMVLNLVGAAECPIVFASSLTAATPDSEYARGKWMAELVIAMRTGSGSVRLPGLFGPPRTDGVIYEAEQAIARGELPFVPMSDWPVANVRDAAEHLVAVALGETHELRVTSGHAVISDLQRARTAHAAG